MLAVDVGASADDSVKPVAKRGSTRESPERWIETGPSRLESRWRALSLGTKGSVRRQYVITQLHQTWAASGRTKGKACEPEIWTYRARYEFMYTRKESASLVGMAQLCVLTLREVEIECHENIVLGHRCVLSPIISGGVPCTSSMAINAQI